MKILFVNTGPWGTGSFTLVKGLANELIKLGHQVKIFFPDGKLESDDLEEYYQNPKLYKIWSFPLNNGSTTLENFPLMISDPYPRNPQANTFKQLTTDQQNLYEGELKKELESLIASFRPDVIECHHIWYPAWILNQLGIYPLITAHQSDQMGFIFDKKVRKKAIASAQAVKTIIAISESVKRQVMELYHVQEEKVIIISNGYDQEVYKPNPKNKELLTKELQNELGLYFLL